MDYTHLIEGIRDRLQACQDGFNFRISDLLKAELLTYNDLSFLPRFIERWPELEGSDIWTFSVSKDTLDDMVNYMVESHYNALPPERV